MSFSGILPYVRARMSALNFDEHPDAFNSENIPRTDFDTIYHVEIGDATSVNEAHDNVEINVPVIVRLFKRHFRNTNETRDEVMAIADSVVDEFVRANVRLTDSSIKTISFDSMSIEQLDESNDNASILTLQFQALIIKSTR